MFGAITKTYYAEKAGIKPEDIFVVSIMPCTAKKFEMTRDDESAAGVPDIDASLTTRELAEMIKTSGIMFHDLPNEQCDPSFASHPALRTSSAHRRRNGSRPAHGCGSCHGYALRQRGIPRCPRVEGIKEAEYDLAGRKSR
jgi:NADP-reducing hydrogenase subunit HndD